MRTTRVDPVVLRRLRLGRDIDDRAFLGTRRPDVGDLDRRHIQTTGGHPSCRAHGALVCLQSRAVHQVRVEQDLQIRPQRGQFRAQRSNLIGGLGAQLGGELPAELSLDGELVLAPR